MPGDCSTRGTLMRGAAASGGAACTTGVGGRGGAAGTGFALCAALWAAASAASPGESRVAPHMPQNRFVG